MSYQIRMMMSEGKIPNASFGFLVSGTPSGGTLLDLDATQTGHPEVTIHSARGTYQMRIAKF